MEEIFAKLNWATKEERTIFVDDYYLMDNEMEYHLIKNGCQCNCFPFFEVFGRCFFLQMDSHRKNATRKKGLQIYIFRRRRKQK